MKRCLLVFIIALLIIPAACFADQDILVSGGEQVYDNIQVLGRNCYVTGTGNDQRIHIYYELYNAGTNPIEVDANNCSIQFLDGNGQEIYSTHEYLLFYPHIVKPGQRFFLADQIIREHTPDAFPVATQAAEYRLKIKLKSSYNVDELYKFAYDFLPVKWTCEKKQSNFFEKIFGSKGEHYYEFTFDVTNNTGVDIINYGNSSLGRIDLLVILRDEKGAPIFVSNESGGFATPAVLELADGETKHAKVSSNVSMVFDFFAKYDYTVSSSELLAYVKLNY